MDDAAPPAPPDPVRPAGLNELTPRAIVVGLAVAAIVGSSYPYVVLKLGFGPNMSVVAAFFGYLALGIVSRTFNRWENNVVETAGTAAGQTAFLCSIMAAFDILSTDPDVLFGPSLTHLQAFLWLTSAGCLGVLLAVPLRQHFIVDEKLPYPDGMAAGQTLIVLDSKGPQARRTAGAMFGALGLSAVTFVAQHFGLAWTKIPILLNRFSAATGFGAALSFLALGSGMIIGLRVCASMVIGTVLSWVILPVLLHDAGALPADASKPTILLWVMWPATGMLVASGLASLLFKWRLLARSFESLKGASADPASFPLRWVAIGAVISSVALILVQKFALGLPVWQTIVAILFTIPLMLVGLRVLGETNWGPISALSNLMQGIFGLVAPGNIRANMIASGVTGSVAADSEAIMQSYRAGAMIGTRPRALATMQLLAIPVGALAVAVMYPILRDDYGLIGMHLPDGSLVQEGLDSPISAKWVGFAKIVAEGFDALPAGALPAFVVGAVLGIVLTALEQRRSWKPFVPSPTGVGIGMLVSATYVVTMLVGGLVEWLWRQVDAPTAARYAIPVASGLIAGEALAAVLLPIAVTVGLL